MLYHSFVAAFPFWLCATVISFSRFLTDSNSWQVQRHATVSDLVPLGQEFWWSMHLLRSVVRALCIKICVIISLLHLRHIESLNQTGSAAVLLSSYPWYLLILGVCGIENSKITW